MPETIPASKQRPVMDRTQAENSARTKAIESDKRALEFEKLGRLRTAWLLREDAKGWRALAHEIKTGQTDN